MLPNNISLQRENIIEHKLQLLFRETNMCTILMHVDVCILNHMYN